MKAARPVSVLTEPGGKGKEKQSGTLMDAQLETEPEEGDLDIARRGSEKQMPQKGWEICHFYRNSHTKDRTYFKCDPVVDPRTASHQMQVLLPAPAAHLLQACKVNALKPLLCHALKPAIFCVMH